MTGEEERARVLRAATPNRTDSGKLPPRVCVWVRVGACGCGEGVSGCVRGCVGEHPLPLFPLFFLSLSRTSLLRSTHLQVVILAGVLGKSKESPGTKQDGRLPHVSPSRPHVHLGTKQGKRNDAL